MAAVRSPCFAEAAGAQAYNGGKTAARLGPLQMHVRPWLAQGGCKDSTARACLGSRAILHTLASLVIIAIFNCNFGIAIAIMFFINFG
jgi:hypothetical protein